MREVVVARFGTPLEAELAAMMLRSHGIDARLQDEALVGAALQLSPILGGVKIVVGVLYADTARELLDKYQEASDAPAEEGRHDAAEATIRRAFRMSIVGLMLLPLALHLYSEYLLLKCAALPMERGRVRWQRRVAHIINAVVILAALAAAMHWLSR